MAVINSWNHPDAVERWLGSMAIGRTLNVCCGMSRVGEVRVDTDPNSERTEDGDMFNLRFEPKSFDTVICDPPFSIYNRFRWIMKLSDLARKRFTLSHPGVAVHLPKHWNRTLFALDSGRLFLRYYWVFDAQNEILQGV